jgi:hypothetical protein
MEGKYKTLVTYLKILLESKETFIDREKIEIILKALEEVE